MRKGTPFHKDIHSALLLFSLLLLITLLWLQDTGLWPLPDAVILPLWLATNVGVGYYVLFVYYPRGQTRKRDAAAQAGKAGTQVQEPDADEAQRIREFQYGIASVFFGAVATGLLDLLTRLGFAPVLRHVLVPIGFAAMGVSYLVIRRLRKVGKLP